MQSIDGHLNGGIPNVDVESLKDYWQTFTKLKDKLFRPLREGFYALAVDREVIRGTIYGDTEFSAYADKVEAAFEAWKSAVDKKLRSIAASTKHKDLIAEMAEMRRSKRNTCYLYQKCVCKKIQNSYGKTA